MTDEMSVDNMETLNLFLKNEVLAAKYFNMVKGKNMSNALKTIQNKEASVKKNAEITAILDVQEAHRIAKLLTDNGYNVTLTPVTTSGVP